MYGTRLNKDQWKRVLESISTGPVKKKTSTYEKVEAFSEDEGGASVFVYITRGVKIRKTRKVSLSDAPDDWRRL